MCVCGYAMPDSCLISGIHPKERLYGIQVDQERSTPIIRLQLHGEEKRRKQFPTYSYNPSKAVVNFPALIALLQDCSCTYLPDQTNGAF